MTIAPDGATSVATLTATPTTHDTLGNPVNVTYQWLQNGNLIANQTSATLSLSAVSSVKVGDTFTVQVTPSDGTYTGSTFTSLAVTIKTISPVTINAPALTALAITPTTATKTSTLTAVPTSSDPASFTYQWQRNGTNIPGATMSTLDLTTVSGATTGDKITVTGTPVEGPLTGSPLTSSPVTLS